MAAEHLPALYLGSVLTGDGVECDESACVSTVDSVSFDATRRGTVTLSCPAEGIPPMTDPAAAPVCTVIARSGDPMLVPTAKDPMFAGAVDDYVVLYLEADAPAGGYVAKRFGAPEGLASGYHILRMQPFDFDGELAKQPCRDEAKTEAVARYNAMHGAGATEADVALTNCHEPGCEQVRPHGRALRGEWHKQMVDAGCPFGPTFTSEPPPGDAEVSLTIRPGYTFLLVASGAR